jgi:hypothetical protein
MHIPWRYVENPPCELRTLKSKGIHLSGVGWWSPRHGPSNGPHRSIWTQTFA